MPSSRPRILILLLALSLGAVQGEDVVLVPLESDATEVLEALSSLELGRYREGIESLERVLGRASALGEPVGLIRVPEGFPSTPGRTPAELRQALAAPGGDAAGAPAADPAARDSRRQFPGRPLAPVLSSAEGGRRFLPFTAVRDACLATLPPEGLRVYRELFDDLARSLLEAYREKGDLEALRRTATELFFSSSGDEALEALGDLANLRGSYREALGAWRRVVDVHPDPDVPRERIRRKVLGTLALLGLSEEHALEREKLAQSLGTDETRLAELLRELPPLQPRFANVPPAPASRWGGEITPRPAPFAAASLLELSWDSWGWSERGIDRQGLRQVDRFGGGTSSFRHAFELDAPYFPFCPLVDGDRLFISSVFSLFRLDARPGGGAIIQELRKPAGTQETALFEEREGSDSAFYTATLWRRAHDPGAPAVIPLSPAQPAADEILITHYISDAIQPTKYLGYDITVELPIRSLVALDASTGRVLWQTGTTARSPAEASPAEARGGLLPPGDAARRRVDPRLRQLEARDPEGIEDMEEWADDEESPRAFRALPGRRAPGGSDNEGTIPRDFSYTSPVIARSGRVVAGGWIQVGSVNSALRCLSLSTGRVLWETFLSGSQMEQTMFGEIAREPFAGAILEADDVVYYVNQGGVVAALELETGAVRWLMTYDTIQNDPSWQRQANRRMLCWGANPLLLLDHVLIVTPRDSDQLYAIDTGTGPAGKQAGGRVLWKHRNPILEQGQAELRDLAGFAGGKLYFTGPGDIRNGPSIVAALDLTQLDAFGRLSGESPQKLGPLRVPVEIPGPARVTSEGVIFADTEGLQLASLDLKSVSPLTSRPFRPHEGRSYPGRIVVEAGRVYMASRKLLSAFAPGERPDPQR